MIKKTSKLILIFLSILLVIFISVSFVASQHTHHLETCHEEKCAICNIIHIAREFVYKILILGINIAFINSIVFIITKIYSYNYFALPKSLVHQNVQLNE